jgi:branched-chain amino acid transport system permease protein
MSQLLQLALQGAAIGAVYSLVALGLVLTYKATEVLNFAHGDLVMASAFLGWWLMVERQLPFWAAVMLVAAVMATFSFALESGLMRAIAGQPQYAGVMLTIAIAFIVRGSVSLWLGPESRTYETPWTGKTATLGPTVISQLHLVIIAAGVLVTAAFYALLKRSRIGVAIQASSQNQLAAYLCGVRVKRLNAVVWAVSGAIASICGLLLAPITFVDLNLWTVVLKAFAALVLGGFGSIPGAIAGGLVIGLVEQFSGVYLPDGYKPIVPYVVLIAVLMFYPRGLFGDAHGRRV